MARDAADLVSLVLRLAADPVALDVAGRSARRVVESHRGALTRTIDFLEAALRASTPLHAPTGHAAART